MAEDLLDTIGQLFGPVRGGLAYAVVFVGALLAATTGVVAASVISMGLISLPIMLRYGYDRRLADRRHRGLGHAGADHPAEPGADRAGRPARPLGRRHVRRRLRSRASSSPASTSPTSSASRRSSPTPRRRCPRSSARCAAGELAVRVVVALIPPLVLIFLVLGTIFIGLATPTEGGAMGAVGALALAAHQAAAQLDAAAPGARLDHQAVVVRALHPDRLARLQPDLLRRRRPPVGGEPADRPARRPARLPDRRQPPGLRPGLLPRFLRARLHHRAAARPGRGRTSASTSSGSASCSASTCRRRSCIRRSASRCSTCARWRRASPTSTASPAQTIAPITTGQIYWGAAALRRHPGDHDRPDHHLPRHGDALQGRARSPVAPASMQIQAPQFGSGAPDFGGGGGQIRCGRSVSRRTEFRRPGRRCAARRRRGRSELRRRRGQRCAQLRRQSRRQAEFRREPSRPELRPMKKAPDSSGALSFRFAKPVLAGAAACRRAAGEHEVVVGAVGDLEPEVLLVAERLHRLVASS